MNSDEVPNGKYCIKGIYGSCPFLQEAVEFCSLPRSIGYGDDRKVKEGEGFLRVDDCLEAYPNGATVTITPKEPPTT